jgi:type I restriction enzyme S subunit
MNNFNEEKLPVGWEVKSLADIGNIFSGNSINAKLKEEKYTNREGTPYVATKDISYNSVINYDNGINIPFNDVNKFRIAKSETVLICAEGGSAGRKVGILNQDVYFVNKLFALETISEVNSKFCFYWYLSKEFKSNFKDKLKGLIGGVSKTDFKNLPIPVPPLEEQKRIVAKIDTLFVKIDRAISLTEESLKQAKNLLPSVLKEVFEKGKADGWEEKKLEEVIEKTKNVNPKTSSFDEFTYIDISAVDKSLQEIVLPKTVKSIDAPSRAKKSIKFDDILFATTRPNLKNIAIVSELYDFPIASTGFCVVRSNSEAHNRYLFYYLISDLLQEQIKPFIRGAQYPAISDKDLKSVLIPVPNLKEQIQVSALFDKISDESKETQSKLERKLAYLKQLKSSILSKAFKGEL